MQFSPNISWLFPELSFGERVAAVANAGFDAIEMGFPTHCDIPAIEAAVKNHGVKVIMFNQDVPVWDSANRGYLCDPGRRDEFFTRLDEALDLAERLHAQTVMLPAGVVIKALHKEAQRDCMIDNLIYAAKLSESASIRFTIEVLNPLDNPGYFLTSTKEAFDIIRQVNHPFIKFQFDTYHIQLIEGNITQKIVDSIDLIGHIQFADVPGRHEPGTGEINFTNLSRAIHNAGYQGYVGLEYIPQAQGAQTLAWTKQL